VEVSLFSDRELNALLLRVPSGSYSIQASGDSLLVNGQTMAEFVVWGPDDKEITISDGSVIRTYTGKIIIRSRRGVLMITDYLMMEEYLASVVAAEMGQAPMEALKAQAVLSRTLAFERITRTNGHFADNEAFQVYRGTGPRTDECLEAVRATRDEVMVWGEKKPRMVQVFFHGSCGGYLARPSQVWGGYDLPYLFYGPDPPCAGDTTQAWRMTFGSDSLWRMFGTMDCPKVIRTDSSGRALQVGIGGVKIRGTEFRKLLGLRSTFITGIECDSDSVLITGRGYGHGIGLCQTGAMIRAMSGDNYLKILAFYYPGARVILFGQVKE
ncbi:MAG: SpoIID/LytB domain-containing protein, partial [Candidatus Hydrothermia bacterium]